MDGSSKAYKKIVNPDNGFSLYIFNDGDEFMDAMAGIPMIPKSDTVAPFAETSQQQRNMDEKLRAVSRRLKEIHKKSFTQERRLSELASENKALKQKLQHHENRDMIVSAQFLMGLVFVAVVSVIALFVI